MGCTRTGTTNPDPGPSPSPNPKPNQASDVCGAWAGEEAAAAGRACAALLRATPPARQFAPLYLCRVLVGSEAFTVAWLTLTLTPNLTPNPNPIPNPNQVGSEAFAVAWLDGDPRVSPRVGALEILLGGALADGKK